MPAYKEVAGTALELCKTLAARAAEPRPPSAPAAADIFSMTRLLLIAVFAKTHIPPTHCLTEGKEIM